MPTIEDLHAAFSQLEHDAPSEITVLPSLATSNMTLVHALARTSFGQRRSLTAIGGAVAVAATVAAIVTVSSLASGGSGHGTSSAAAEGSSSGPVASESPAPSPSPASASSATTATASAASAVVLPPGVSPTTKTPVKFAYLPIHSAVTSVTVGAQKFESRAPEVEVDYDHLIITVLPGIGLRGKSGPTADHAPQTTTISVNGFSGAYSPQDTVTVVDNGTMTIAINNYNGTKFVGPGLGLPLTEITKILQGVTVTATPFDQSGWFDLATALP